MAEENFSAKVGKVLMERFAGHSVDTPRGRQWVYAGDAGGLRQKWAVSAAEKVTRMSPTELDKVLFGSIRLVHDEHADGVLFITDEPILLPTTLQHLRGIWPRVQHVTLDALEAPLALQRELSLKTSFNGLVEAALWRRFRSVEAQPPAYAGADFLVKARPAVPGPMAATEWLVMTLPQGMRTSQKSLNSKLEVYLAAILKSGGDGVMIVTRSGLPFRTSAYIPGSKVEVFACTLKQLQAGEVDLSAAAPGGRIATESPVVPVADGGRVISSADVAENSAYPGKLIRIDRESLSYKNAMRAMNSLSEGMRGDNSPAPSGLRADRTKRLLAEVDSGRSLMSADTVREDAARTILPGPLKWLRDQAAQASIREFAGEAIKWLKEIFKGWDIF